MKEASKTKLILYLEYAFVVLVIGIFLYRIFALSGAQLAKYPLEYSGGDGISGLVAVKSMQENGWIYENPRLGAPFGVENYDATTMETFLSAIEQVLVWLTGNWILAYNIFYLSGYFLAGITALYALKQLKIPGKIAAPTAVLYTFLPYHFQRGTNHMFLGMYFMVPIMVLYLFRIMNGDMIFQKGNKGWFTRSNVIRLLTIMIMALTGIYYTFFTCFFLCVVILYCLLNKDDWKKIRQAAFSIGVIIVTLLLAAMPNFIYWMQEGRPSTLSKGGEGAEIYALKIIQLLLPRQGHRLEILMRVRNLYDSAYPLTNENGTASLGVFMAVGFIILCIVLFIGKRVSDKSNLRIGSILNLSAILFGTVGGYAVVLSFFTGAIRCYNRFSVFIAMFSLIAIDSVIQMIYEKWFQKKWKNLVFAFCMIGVMLCGIYDQTGIRDSSIYDVYEARFDEDATFVGAIESAEPVGAMIYQMPYMKYPENGAILNMQDYSHMVGYLHSDSLRWSYGAVAGREGDAWLKSVNELSLEKQITVIKEAGFAGIYVDWNAYLEDERAVMEEVLTETVDAEPIVNTSGTKAYYSFQ